MDTKSCEHCGDTFGKPPGVRGRQWAERRFCSLRCAYASRKGTRTGEAHPSWKGGRVEDGGYMRVRRNGRYEQEHRVVMEEALGRPLRADETVHHLNGNGLDNRLSNLQLRVGRHGRGAALCCADCGSVNLRPLEL